MGFQRPRSHSVFDEASRAGHVDVPDLEWAGEQVPLTVKETDHRHDSNRQVGAQVLNRGAHRRDLPSHRLNQLGLVPPTHEQARRLGPEERSVVLRSRPLCRMKEAWWWLVGSGSPRARRSRPPERRSMVPCGIELNLDPKGWATRAP